MKKPARPHHPQVISHYTVTPIPPTPPTFWEPHRNLTNLPQPQPLPIYPEKLTPNINVQEDFQPVNSNVFETLTPVKIPSPSTTRRTTTTTKPTTISTTTTRVISSEFEFIDNDDGPSVDYRNDESDETFNSSLWVDVPTDADLPQPDIANVSNVIERQIQTMREKYQQMGVPRRYLTKDMIWKLIRGGGGPGVHFQKY